MSIYEIDNGPLTQTEVHLYGSSRLGIYNTQLNVTTLSYTSTNLNGLTSGGINTTFNRGNKFFELSNHLGNVLATISDRTLQVQNGTTGLVDFYQADVVTASDCYPFGMTMPGRKFTAPSSNYRFGFQGQEKDDEIKGEGNSVNYTYRMEDTRLGRFFSVDPLTSKYPFYSPYAFSGNRVIDATELEGLEPNNVHSEEGINGAGQFDATTLGQYTNRGPETRFGSKDKEFTSQELFDKDGTSVGNLVKRMIPVGDATNYGQSVEGYEEAYMVTNAKMSAFKSNSDKYYDISRNYALYDLLWGEMDRNPPAGGLLDPRYYLLGRVTGAVGKLGFRALVAYGRAAGLIYKETTVTEELMLVANKPFKQTGQTVLADAMASHSKRQGSSFNLKAGKPTLMNAQANEVLKSILTHPKAVIVVRPHGRFGTVIDVTTPVGGARFTGDGKTFCNLLEN